MSKIKNIFNIDEISHIIFLFITKKSKFALINKKSYEIYLKFLECLTFTINKHIKFNFLRKEFKNLKTIKISNKNSFQNFLKEVINFKNDLNIVFSVYYKLKIGHYILEEEHKMFYCSKEKIIKNENGNVLVIIKKESIYDIYLDYGFAKICEYMDSNDFNLNISINNFFELMYFKSKYIRDELLINLIDKKLNKRINEIYFIEDLALLRDKIRKINYKSINLIKDKDLRLRIRNFIEMTINKRIPFIVKNNINEDIKSETFSDVDSEDIEIEYLSDSEDSENDQTFY